MRKILAKIGVPHQSIGIIKNLYENNIRSIKVNNTLKDVFEVMKDVRQGCILSPIIYRTYSEKGTTIRVE